MKKLAMMAIGLTILSSPSPVLASERTTNSLTPVKIRQFIDHVTEKTKPGGRLDDAEIVSYLNAHLSNDGTYSSNILFQIPGYPEQVRALTLNKSEYIKNILDARKALKDADSSVKVSNISINKDKTKASISTITHQEGKMPVDPTTYLPFEGETHCSQELELIEKMIVIKSASCESRTTIFDR